MGNTEQIIREFKASRAGRVVLRGTLWVGAGVVGVVVKQLLEWKAAGLKIGTLDTIDVVILLAMALWEMCKTWLTYIDSSFSDWKQEREAEKKRISETEFMRQQTAAK